MYGNDSRIESNQIYINYRKNDYIACHVEFDENKVLTHLVLNIVIYYATSNHSRMIISLIKNNMVYNGQFGERASKKVFKEKLHYERPIINFYIYGDIKLDI